MQPMISDNKEKQGNGTTLSLKRQSANSIPPSCSVLQAYYHQDDCLHLRASPSTVPTSPTFLEGLGVKDWLHENPGVCAGYS